MRSREWSFVVVAGVLAGGFAAHTPTRAQVATAVIREGDTIPGVGTVQALNIPVVNHAQGYAVTLNTTDGVSTVWGNASGGPGALIFSEGTYAGYEQTSYESFHGLSNAGDPGYSAIVTELSSGTTGLDSVWVGATPVLVEEQEVPSLPGQFSVFNSRAGMTSDGHPFWVGGTSDTQGGATQTRVLFFGFGATPLFMGGDPVGGVAEPAQSGTGAVDFNVRFSELGSNWVMEVLVTSSSANDGVVVSNGNAVTIDGNVIREGFAVPTVAGGLPGESWANFDYFGITEAGLILVTGDTDSVSTQDEFVLLDGVIVMREGDALIAPSGFVTVNGAIEGAYLNEDGDWGAIWDVDDTMGTNREALIFNDELVLMEGDTVDLDGDGEVEPDSVLVNFSGISTLVIGDRGDTGVVPVYFTADIDTEGTPTTSDDVEAVFRIDLSAENQPPVAVCQDVIVEAGSSCEADADIDDGSFDPDGDPITLEQTPPGPYGPGETSVTLTVTDDQDLSDTCTATVTVVPEPLELAVSLVGLDWGPAVCDVGYDVVRGDLESLNVSAGDYASATEECLANDHPSTSLSYGVVPDGGAGFWFLARRVGADGNGTYDSGGPGQQGDRDSGIADSGVDCP